MLHVREQEKKKKKHTGKQSRLWWSRSDNKREFGSESVVVIKVCAVSQANGSSWPRCYVIERQGLRR
eukprot:m.118735 g.118735  ORF g.118735 m.118735 type:complete len:67 (+) comp13662_c1_seq4:3250-3450(+)